jgi:hypothetical protein
MLPKSATQQLPCLGLLKQTMMTHAARIPPPIHLRLCPGVGCTVQSWRSMLNILHMVHWTQENKKIKQKICHDAETYIVGTILPIDYIYILIQAFVQLYVNQIDDWNMCMYWNLLTTDRKVEQLLVVNPSLGNMLRRASCSWEEIWQFANWHLCATFDIIQGQVKNEMKLTLTSLL